MWFKEIRRVINISGCCSEVFTDQGIVCGMPFCIYLCFQELHFYGIVSAFYWFFEYTHIQLSPCGAILVSPLFTDSNINNYESIYPHFH